MGGFRKARMALGLFLGLAILLGTALPAFASGGDGSWAGIRERSNRHDSDLDVYIRAKLDLDDVGGAAWARAFIADLATKGLMRGRGQHHFAPNAPVTHAEAVTVAGRLLYGDAAARAAGEEILRLDPRLVEQSFVDAASIPAWAVPFTAVAVKQNLVDAGGEFQAHRESSRLYVIRLLVKTLLAAGTISPADFQAASSQTLQFTDASQVSVADVPYVVLAVSNGLVGGYPDGSLRPHNPVTRDEMAKIVSESGNQNGLGSGSQQLGEVTAVDPTAHTVTVRLIPRILPPLPVPLPITPQGGGGGQGTVTGGTYGTVTDGTYGAPVPPAAVTYPVAIGAVIVVNGHAAGLQDLQAGDRVRFIVSDAAEITVLFATFRRAYVEGTVKAVAGADGGPASLTIESTSADGVSHVVTYGFSSTARIFYRGGEVDLTALAVGDRVKAALHGTVIMSVTDFGQVRELQPERRG